MKLFAGSAPERRLRWRRWLARAADVGFAVVLLATLALALAPFVSSLLHSDVRAAIRAEASAVLPAVDRAGTAFAGLR